MRFAVTFLACLLVSAGAFALPPGTESEIRDRLQPAGSLCVAGDECGAATAGGGSTGTGLSGEAIYNQFCFACHATGAGGAPLFGDAAAWAPRVEKGIDTLWQSTIDGIPPGMPARGTCMDCSDEELKSAAQYMVDAVQ